MPQRSMLSTANRVRVPGVMSQRLASKSGSGLFSTLSNAVVVLGAIALLAVGLFAASDAIANRAQSTAAPQSKIGPAYENKRPAPVPAAVARVDTPAAPVDRPEPVVERVVTAPKPVDQQPPVTAVAIPVEPPSVAKPAPERTETASDRPAPGSAGCTRYRTYNPTTQTYRAFDGTIRRCTSADRGT